MTRRNFGTTPGDYGRCSHTRQRWFYDNSEMWLRSVVRDICRRSRKREIPSPVKSVAQLSRHLDEHGWFCHWCGGVTEQIDHVVPRDLGGSDKLLNLVPSCAPCNSAKSSWMPEKWLGEEHRSGGELCERCIMARKAHQDEMRVDLPEDDSNVSRSKSEGHGCDGMWRGPAMSDEQKQRLYGRPS